MAGLGGRAGASEARLACGGGWAALGASATSNAAALVEGQYKTGGGLGGGHGSRWASGAGVGRGVSRVVTHYYLLKWRGSS